MYMMLDALADGGVFAGVPKDVALKLTAYTMMVSYTLQKRYLFVRDSISTSILCEISTSLNFFYTCREQQKWC